ncbi:hypothetical protein PG996_008807 [Apiospora saccharicola]|uniref:F-box domain-containing protein n=1 Tax=Apiospora saccharicola TaxID=335842 RepID=A0ABR1UYZ0_9PEZI
MASSAQMSHYRLAATGKFDGMISMATIAFDGRMPKLPITPLRLQDSSSSSSFGILGRLPPELMLNIVAQMDFLSIVHFSQVCVQANGYVRSCNELRDVLRFVPEAVKALGIIGVLSLHSVATLYDAMRAEECATCGDTGPFLFLPTCQRCCEWCRKYYPSLQLMFRSQAGKYCALTQQETDSLPTVHVRRVWVKQGGGPRSGDAWTIHGQAVVAQTARDRSLSVHGSWLRAKQAVMARCVGPAARLTGQYWTKAHRARPRFDWFTSEIRVGEPRQVPRRVTLDNYATMATMPFPTLTEDQTLEDARWCEGCVRTRAQFWDYRYHHFTEIGANIQEAMRASIPKEYRTVAYRPSVVLFGLPDRAWSRESFERHIRDYPGAQTLLKEGL